MLPLPHHDISTFRHDSYLALEALNPQVLVGNPDANRVRQEMKNLRPEITGIPE